MAHDKRIVRPRTAGGAHANAKGRRVGRENGVIIDLERVFRTLIANASDGRSVNRPRRPLPIDAIPGLCGYASTAHFKVDFRHLTGMTMREWRKRHT